MLREFYTRIVTGTSLGAGVIALFFMPLWVFVSLGIFVIIRILTREWPRLFHYKEPAFWMLMPFYPLLPLLLILHMHIYGYETINMFFITIVGAHDSGSYFFGKYLGKTKIYPTISPGKTWEGFAGGLLLAFMFSLIFFGHNSLAVILTYIVPLTAVICVLALAGDLFESALKRRAGIKDAGSFLPGHGGVLDRIDGILFAAPLIFMLRRILIVFI